MVENWIVEEDDEEISNDFVQDELDKLEAHEEVDSAEYDDSDEEENDVIMTSSCEKNRKKLTHVDETSAIDVVRECISSLNLPGDCEMSLEKLQRQIASEIIKVVNQQPSITSRFPSKSK